MWNVLRRWWVRPAGVVLVVATGVVVGAGVAARAATLPPTKDFVPVHPYVFMTAADVQALRENVNVKKLPWAVDLLARARADADANPPTLQTTGTLSATTTYGKHMLATTLVYLATDDPFYGNRAVDWLLTYANAGVRYSSFDSLADLSGIHSVFAWVYDLVYNFAAQNRPADLAKITSWLTSYMNSLFGSFTINTGFEGNCGKAAIAYALGKGSVIDDIGNQFRAWYESMPDGYYGDFWSGQAFKNYDITLECLVTYAMASHHAAERGYSAFDALTWKTSNGFNLVQNQWRTMVKYSTPRFQVPFQATWRGPLFWIPNGTAVAQELYATTHDPEEGTIVAANPGRSLDAVAVDGNWETIDPWPGLTHGREVDNATGIRNDSFNDSGRGFAVMLSGDPAGFETPDSLQAYLMHGSYGAVEPLNLKLYGKGEKLTEEHDTNTTDNFGERGGGGIYVTPLARQNLPPDDTTPSSSDILLWDVNPDVKIIAADYHGLGGTVLPNYHRRTVAVTSDYFFDLYDVNDTAATLYTYQVDGVGPDTTVARLDGRDLTNPQSVPTSADISVSWPNHMKLTMINRVPSTVTMFKSIDLPPAITYPTDPIHVLRVRRATSGPQRFEGIYEPLGEGGSPSITAVTPLPAGPGDVVAVKVSAPRFTDYLGYVAGGPSASLGASTVGSGTETLTLNGRYGYVRFDRVAGVIRAWGSVTGFTLPAAGASAVCIDGQPSSFASDGVNVTWPGSGAGTLDPTLCSPAAAAADVTPPSAPTGLVVSGSTPTSLSLTWNASADAGGVAGYGLYLDGARLPDTQATSTTFSALGCGTTHFLGVDAVDVAGNRSPITTTTATTPACDTTPPTVSVARPTPAATVSGAVLVSAVAADAGGLAGVRLLVDGVDLAPELTSAPYETTWDTTTVPDGPHTLTAVARDTSGNTATSAPVPVTVSNGLKIAFVQDLGSASAGNTGNSIALTIGGRGVAKGDTVVVWAGMSSKSITISSVTDSRGNPYTVDATVNHPVSSLNSFVASGHAATALLPGDTINVTFSASLYSARLIAAAEFRGVAPTAGADQRATATGSGATPATPLTPTASQADELVVQGIETDTTAVCTPATGFTALGSATASPSGVTRTIHQAYRIVNTAGPQRAAATLSSPGFWTAAVVTYPAG